MPMVMKPSGLNMPIETYTHFSRHDLTEMTFPKHICSQNIFHLNTFIHIIFIMYTIIFKLFVICMLYYLLYLYLLYLWNEFREQPQTWIFQYFLRTNSINQSLDWKMFNILYWNELSVFFFNYLFAFV